MSKPEVTNEVPAILSVSEAAKLLSVTSETVCRFIATGQLAASGLGTRKDGTPCAPYAVQGSDLILFLDQRRVTPGADNAPAPSAIEQRVSASRTAQGRRSSTASRRHRRAVRKLVEA